jgi:hypothetical protein
MISNIQIIGMTRFVMTPGIVMNLANLSMVARPIVPRAFHHVQLPNAAVGSAQRHPHPQGYPRSFHPHPHHQAAVFHPRQILAVQPAVVAAAEAVEEAEAVVAAEEAEPAQTKAEALIMPVIC